jgi:type IV pilus assembly protein PilP
MDGPDIAAAVPAEKEKTEIPFQYNPEGRRDPFKSIIVSSEKQALTENLPPLQRKELSELKVIGIVWGGFGYGAVIQTPDGKGYPVRRGTRMGLNNGVISRITNKEIVVQEKYLDIFNERKTRDVVMELHPHKEGLE